MKVQITLMDDRDYILDYKDVEVYEHEENYWEVNYYVSEALKNEEVVNIRVRKWED